MENEVVCLLFWRGNNRQVPGDYLTIPDKTNPIDFYFILGSV